MPPQRRSDTWDDQHHLPMVSVGEADESDAAIMRQQLPEISNHFFVGSSINKHDVVVRSQIPKTATVTVSPDVVTASLHPFPDAGYYYYSTAHNHSNTNIHNVALTPPLPSQQEQLAHHENHQCGLQVQQQLYMYYNQIHYHQEEEKATDAAEVVIPSPSQIPSSQSKPKKSVRFSPEVTVRDIPTVSIYGKSELESLWITEEDFLQIRKKRQQTIDRMRWGYSILIDDTEHTDIGLYTYTEQLRKDARVQYARNVVLEEQYYHNYELAQDIGSKPDHLETEYAIAQAYYEATSDVQEEALERGLWLQEDMLELYNDEDHDDDVETNDLLTFNSLRFSASNICPSIRGVHGRNSIRVSTRCSERSTNTDTRTSLIRKPQCYQHSTSSQQQQHYHVKPCGLSVHAATGMVTEMLSIFGCA